MDGRQFIRRPNTLPEGLFKYGRNGRNCARCPVRVDRAVTVAGRTAMTDEFSISVNEYGFYAVPVSYARREVPRILAAGEVYEPKTVRLIRRNAGAGDVIAGGAFVGDFFPAISARLAPKARLYSFEPNPLSFRAAEETIALNGLKNVSLSPNAVGFEPGKLHLQTETGAGMAAAARAKIVDAGATNTVEVQATTLDQMHPKSRKVSVLQLDIEGHEQPALRGATRILQSSKPMVIVEADRPWRWNMYADLLNQLAPKAGYRFAGHMERNAFYLPGGK